MNKNNPDFFNVLRNIANNPDSSPKKNIGFSLGKLKLLLKKSKTKGFNKS